MSTLPKKIIITTLGAIIALELASLLSFAFPPAAPWIFGIISIIAIALIFYKWQWGIMLAFIELAIGSLGTMLALNIEGFNITLRMVIWIAVLLSWALQQKIRQPAFLQSALFKPYLFLAILIAWGIVWGLVQGNSLAAIFSDVNNYLYFLLIFPIYDFFTAAKDAMNRVSTAILTAASWLALKTIFLFYVFSHELFGLQDFLYAWSRRSRLAEITNIDPELVLSRIFMQSQIWILFGVFVLLGVIARNLYSGDVAIPESVARASRLPRRSPGTASLLAMTILFIAALIASMSRSFWLAGVVSIIILFIGLIAIREPIKKVASFVSVSAGIIVLGIGLAVVAIKFPIPPSNADSSLIRERAGMFTGEAAVSSRWSQIKPLMKSIAEHPVWGKGFGTLVTYQSQDPRVLAKNPDGWYTTSAFELGWLEVWLKIGLLGLAAYLYLLWRILKTGWQKIKIKEGGYPYIILGSLVGLIAVTLTHGVSPYLNHPLGISIVMLVTALVDHKHTHGEQGSNPNSNL